MAGGACNEVRAEGPLLQLGAGLPPLLHQQAGEDWTTSRACASATPPAPIWQESIRALGATPVAMAFGEMYPGLQQRAIDGVELVYNNIPGGRFYEVSSPTRRSTSC